jgi:hypothetical protein
MTGTSGKRYILTRFFFQVFGSWAVAPIGFLVAQALGQGDNKYLYLYLTITSLSAGCGLFLNEILAPQNAFLKRSSLRVANSELACFLFLALSLLLYFSLLAEQTGSSVPSMALVFLVLTALFSSWLSYSTSTIFCRALADKSSNLPRRTCFVLGLVPPIITQLFVIFISFVGSDIPVALGVTLVGLTTFVPSLSQYLYARASLGGRLVGFALERSVMIEKFRHEVLWMLISISAISFSATLLKGHIAELSNAYSNLSFLALNIVGTIVMLYTKSSFFVGSPRGFSLNPARRLLGYMATSSLSAFVVVAPLLVPGFSIQFTGSLALIILLSISMQLLLLSTRTLALL